MIFYICPTVHKKLIRSGRLYKTFYQKPLEIFIRHDPSRFIGNDDSLVRERKINGPMKLYSLRVMFCNLCFHYLLNNFTPIRLKSFSTINYNEHLSGYDMAGIQYALLTN